MLQTEKQIIARLQAPFLPDEHEYMERFQLIYLREAAINDRLTKVLGRSGWNFNLVGAPNIYTDSSGEISVTQGARLTMKIPMRMGNGEYDIAFQECHYENVGGDKLLKLGIDIAERVMNTIKGATTDSFKRCAASMGVGLYLKELPSKTTLDMLPNHLQALGYVPDLKLATVMFLKETGMPTAKSVTDEEYNMQLKKRVDWKKSWGFNDYDMMTLNKFMIGTYNEWAHNN